MAARYTTRNTVVKDALGNALGGIQVLTYATGTIRCRVRLVGSTHYLAGSYASVEEATEALRMIAEKHAGSRASGVTSVSLEQWIRHHFPQRKAELTPDAYRGYRGALNAWLNAPTSEQAKSLPVLAVPSESDLIVKSLMDYRGVTGQPATQTKNNMLSALRTCLNHAVVAKIIKSNPLENVKLSYSATGGKAKRVVKVKAIALEPHEVEEGLARLEQHAGRAAMLVVAAAMGLGQRSSELWRVTLDDVYLRPEDIEGRPPVPAGVHMLPTGAKASYLTMYYKGRGAEKRKVPLFALGLEAVVQWLTVERAVYCPTAHESPYLWPAKAGGRRSVAHPLGQMSPPRQSSKRLDVWREVREVAFGRKVRWHDLRHTAATSLGRGAEWLGGRFWTLDEVRAQLGHIDIKTTLRYFRGVDPSIAAQQAQISFSERALADKRLTNSMEPPKGFEPSTCGLRSVGSAGSSSGFVDEADNLADTLAEETLSRIAAGDAAKAEQNLDRLCSHIEALSPWVRLVSEIRRGGKLKLEYGVQLCRLVRSSRKRIVPSQTLFLKSRGR